MIDIITIKGEQYRFDPETERIFKDGKLIPRSEAEPVYSDTENYPKFSGIFLKNLGSIVSLSGKTNSLTDIENIY